MQTEQIIKELEIRIEDLENRDLPMNSVMAGILLGLQEARDLILEFMSDN